MRRFAFPKNMRLLSSKSFQAVLARRLRFSNELLTLYMAENNCGGRRLGISISKSVGNAVLRNCYKRLLREVFRQSQEQIPDGFDYVIMFSRRATENSTLTKEAITFERLKSAFLSLVFTASKRIKE